MYLFWQRELWNPVRHQNHIGIKDSNLLAHRLESNGICGIYLFNIAWEEFDKHDDAPTLFVQLLCQQNPSCVLLKGAKRETNKKRTSSPPSLRAIISVQQRQRTQGGAGEQGRKGLWIQQMWVCIFTHRVPWDWPWSSCFSSLQHSYFISKGRAGVLWGFTLTELK